MKSSGIGGQAVLEGVMMRNHEKYAVAVRKPDGGIAVKNWETGNIRQKHVLLRLPVVRGVVAFVESLMLGIKTLTYSSSFLEEEELRMEQEDAGRQEDTSGRGKETLENVLIVLLSIVLAIVFFMLLPFGVSELFRGRIQSQTMLAVIEGVLRVLLFLGYVAAISCMNDIKRVYMYHGAEHKTINCVEHGQELTVENVKKQSRYHRRCGTSFLLVVMLVSIVFFLFIHFDNLWLRMLYRILLIPVVAGVSYEFIMLAGNSDHPLVVLLSRPGLWLQRLTTREPDAQMIEVAIASVEAVFDWRAYQAACEKERKQKRRRRHGQRRKTGETADSGERDSEDAQAQDVILPWEAHSALQNVQEDSATLEQREASDDLLWSRSASMQKNAVKAQPESEAAEKAEKPSRKAARAEKARTGKEASVEAQPESEAAEKAEKPSRKAARAEKSSRKAERAEKARTGKEASVEAQPESEAAEKAEKASRKAERTEKAQSEKTGAAETSAKKRKTEKAQGGVLAIFRRDGKKSRTQKRRELEEREKRYRNRAAERARMIKEQEEREAAHEKAYQEAKKHTAERLAATQELPQIDADELKNLDHFFDEKKED